MTKPHSIIFAGTPDFAVPSLRALIDDPAFDVTLVITQPDKPVGRKQVITRSPVKVLAEEHGIRVWQPDDINAEWPPTHYSLPTKPDFLVVVAYGKLLKKNILDIPNIAAVNVHPSLLPLWRGAAPMQHALMHGDTETGVTVQKIIKKMDAGPILGVVKTSVNIGETITTLSSRLAIVGADLLVEILKKPLTETAQDESHATECKKLTRASGNIDPKSMTAKEVDQHVRALVPWPGVKVTIDSTEVKLIETSLTLHPDALELKCKDSPICIVLMQESGKKIMNGSQWLRGKKDGRMAL